MQGANGALGKPTLNSRLEVGRRCLPLAEEVSGLRPDRILCSDLKRCQLLAEAIAARLGLFAEPDPVWRELSFGTWENRTWSDIQAREPQLFSEWMTNFDTVAPPAGESFEQLQARVLTGIEAQDCRTKPTFGWQARTAISIEHRREAGSALSLSLPMPVLSVRPCALSPACPFERHSSWLFRTEVIPAFCWRRDNWSSGSAWFAARENPSLESARCELLLHFVLGGSRSGKSRHAEALAAASGMPVCFVATYATE